MALVLADRVQETCSAPGTGAVTLLGAVTGYQTFSAGVGNANTCYYCIADQSGANWEVGLGTYSTSGNSLARTTPLSGSAATPVNFSSGTQNVFVTYPAEIAVGRFGVTVTGTFAQTAPADGVVLDYTSGTARVSAFASDGVALYNGGVGSNVLFQVNASGAVGVGSGTSSYGTSGQVLTSAGSGAAPTWTNGPILVNSTTVSSNQTIASGTNGFSVGPMTIASGVSVTIASGQRWVVI